MVSARPFLPRNREEALPMLRIDAGQTRGYCDGITRRSFLQAGAAGLAGLTLPNLLRARAEAAGNSSRKDNSVILLWLDGGPSHMDLYRLQPETPPGYRGRWKPVQTNG